VNDWIVAAIIMALLILLFYGVPFLLARRRCRAVIVSHDGTWRCVCLKDHAGCHVGAKGTRWKSELQDF
jgi:hypothetical protein